MSSSSSTMRTPVTGLDPPAEPPTPLGWPGADLMLLSHGCPARRPPTLPFVDDGVDDRVDDRARAVTHGDRRPRRAAGRPGDRPGRGAREPRRDAVRHL